MSEPKLDRFGSAEDLEPEQVMELLTKIEAELAEREDQLLRARADVENVRKHMRRQLELQRVEDRADLLRAFLEVQDNLDRAASLVTEPVDDPVVAGFVQVVSQSRRVLERLGLERVPAAGQPFDPYVHEAISLIEQPELEREEVLEELTPGYRLGNRVLRPAAVVVGRPPPRVKLDPAALLEEE